MDLLSPELLRISYDILSEDLLDPLVIQDVIVWHLQWKLSKTVSLVDVPNPLVEEQFDQSRVSETACLVQRIILILVAILFHLISVALVLWICKIFYQDQFTYLLLIIFNSKHEGRLFFLLLSKERRDTMIFQDVIDHKDVASHTSPVKIAIMDQL